MSPRKTINVSDLSWIFSQCLKTLTIGRLHIIVNDNLARGFSRFKIVKWSIFHGFDCSSKAVDDVPEKFFRHVDTTPFVSMEQLLRASDFQLTPTACTAGTVDLNLRCDSIRNKSAILHGWGTI